MVAILMTSTKLATPVVLKIKVMTSQFLSMTSPTKFNHVTQIILSMWSRDQSLVTLAFL